MSNTCFPVNAKQQYISIARLTPHIEMVQINISNDNNNCNNSKINIVINNNNRKNNNNNNKHNCNNIITIIIAISLNLYQRKLTRVHSFVSKHALPPTFLLLPLILSHSRSSVAKYSLTFSGERGQARYNSKQSFPCWPKMAADWYRTQGCLASESDTGSGFSLWEIKTNIDDSGIVNLYVGFSGIMFHEENGEETLVEDKLPIGNLGKNPCCSVCAKENEDILTRKNKLDVIKAFLGLS